LARVKLIAFSTPRSGSDPRRLAVLAAKVSQGKLHDKPLEHYLSTYSSERVGEWLAKAAEGFPSVLEHVVLTFLIEGISRVCSHQLVRHRIASYTQESQRYSESYARRALEKARQTLERYLAELEEAERGGEPPWLLPIKPSELRSVLERNDPSEILSRAVELLGYDDRIVEIASEAFVIPPTLPPEAKQEIARSYLRSLATYYSLLNQGVPHEDARFALPQAIKTRILMTVNLRELLHIACLRLSTKAQWEIREVVKQMIEEAEKIVPEIEEMLKKFCREW